MFTRKTLYSQMNFQFNYTYLISVVVGFGLEFLISRMDALIIYNTHIMCTHLRALCANFKGDSFILIYYLCGNVKIFNAMH